MANQFDSRKRLMAMFQKELQLEHQENAIAKQSTKFHSNVAAIMRKIKQQQRDCEKLHALVSQRNDQLETRNAFEKAMRDKLAEEKQHLAEMQTQLVNTIEDRSELMSSVRTLSEATNTYINPKALPARVRGVTVSRADNQWIPFDYDAQNLKGLESLWTQLHQVSPNASKWRQLLSTSHSASVPDSSEKENANASMASTIEIDLTLPTWNE